MVAQSGGPTVAINASLAGVIRGVMASDQYETVYGSVNGILGILNNHLLNLTEIMNENPAYLDRLETTPAMYLGSCRYKLPESLEDPVYPKLFRKFEEMKLTPGKAGVVRAPIVEEAPVCIECRVKEIVPLGSHDLFLAEVVNVQADDRYLNPETGKFELDRANPLVYTHGEYFGLGKKIGKFGWSVEKKKKKNKK